MIPFHHQKLRQWFLAEKRDLPWRMTRDPYAIWISEIMLQQTQVAVVLPYYLRWMELFPTVKDLAEASLDVVIKCWEGLGYYSRARNLHAGAKYIMEKFNGRLPETAEELNQIKGIGPYTVGAILSFAFHQRKAAVDGNVMRVLSRYFQIEEDICKGPTIKKISLKAQEILPQEEPWVIAEALIELGATICQRKARCSLCPLSSGCQSYKNGMEGTLPIKSKKIATEYLYRAVAVIRKEGEFLVKRGKQGEIMSDLYEFPFFEVTKEGMTALELKRIIHKKHKIKVYNPIELQTETHGFTRYNVRLDPVFFECKEHREIPDYEWYSLNELSEKPFSSGHRRILHQITEKNGKSLSLNKSF